MKNNRFIGRMLSALLIVIMLITMMPSAFASRCPNNPDGEHYWSEWDTEREATCSRAGQKSRACKYCREVDTKSIPKKSHSYGSWKTTKEATCTKEGERTRKCKVCGHKDKDTIKMKAHSWGEWTVITEPTEFSTGIGEHTCKVCGKTEQKDIYPEGTLKKGDKGDRVKELQTALNDNGYDCGKVDGDFGKKTEKAVQNLETAIGVDPDGIAWPGVIKTLSNPEWLTIRSHHNDYDYIIFTHEVKNEPANGKYFTEGETVVFSFYVENISTDPEFLMWDVQLFDDEISGYHEDTLHYFHEIAAGESASYTFNYTVTAEDVQKHYIESSASLQWEVYGVASNCLWFWLEVDTGESDTVNVYLEKTVESIPANGEYYVLGEEIRYFLRLTNEGEEPITDVEIVDYLKGSSVVTRAESVEPDGSLEAYFTYTVTEDDVRDGRVINQAYGHWNGGGNVTSDHVEVETGPIGETYYFTLSNVAYLGEEYDNVFYIQNLRENAHVFSAMNVRLSHLWGLGLSNEYDAGDSAQWIRVYGTPTQSGEAPCIYSVMVDDDLWIIEVDMFVVERVNGVSMVKRCVSTPNIESGYVEGETVSYQVVISNDSENDLYNTEFTDSLVKGANCTIEAISAGDTYTVEYDYTVTSEDVEREYIGNTASLAFTQGADTATVHSNTVYVPTTSDFEQEIDEMPVWLNKERTNSPADANGYVEGEVIEYEVTVYNDSEFNVYGATLFDPLMDEPKTINVASGDSYTVQYSYTVLSGDVDLGYVDNTAELQYMSGDAETETVSSKTIHTITQRIIDPVPDEPSDSLFIEVIDFSCQTATNPGAIVNGTLRATNTGGETLEIYDGSITDVNAALHTGDYYGPKPAEAYSLAPNASCYLTFDVEIRPEDDPSVIRDLTLTAKAIEGTLQDPVVSNTARATLEIGDEPTPVPREGKLSVIKTETSVPGDGRSFYVKGEKIKYDITVTNENDVCIGQTYIYDTLWTGSEIGYADHIDPHASKTFQFEYTVKDSDVPGYVINYAIADYESSYGWDTETSLPVISPTGEIDTPPTPPADDPVAKINTPVLEGDCCVPTIKARDEDSTDYEQHYCATHFATRTAIEAMAAAAATPEEELAAWQYARVLWQNDSDAMYEALMNAANGPAKVIVMNERILFNAQLASHEAALNALYPDAPAAVAKAIAKLYADRCTLMCYELHTAPEARTDDLTSVTCGTKNNAGNAACASTITKVDGADVYYTEQLCGVHTITSVLTESLLKASGNTESTWKKIGALWNVELENSCRSKMDASDEATRTILNADMRAFKKWAATREALIGLLYPEQGETAAQISAKTVMERVTDLCEGID